MQTGTDALKWIAYSIKSGMIALHLLTWPRELGAASAAPLPRPEDLSATFRTVAADATPSIVAIETITKARQVQGQAPQSNRETIPDPFRDFFRNDPLLEELFRNRTQPRATPRIRGMGSGFIIDASGIILTNHHVVNGVDEVRVRLSDGREFIAQKVKTDPRTDVAIIRIDARGLKPLHFGDSRATQVGDWVLAIGSPFGLDMSVTAGIISAKGRSNQITARADFLQTDAAINPGNSGGPLIDMHGDVIGVNTAIASESGAYEGIGFAIPAHIASWVSQKLISDGEVIRGYIGAEIESADSETARQFKLNDRKGALLRSILPGTPADKSKLEPGDLILQLNDQPIKNPTNLQEIVEQLTIGKQYPVSILRNGKELTLSITIEKMPQSIDIERDDETERGPIQGKYDALGLDVRPLTKSLAKELHVKVRTGLVVAGVEEGSPAAAYGLQSGDIIEKAGGEYVTKLGEYEKMRDQFMRRDGLLLTILSRDGHRSFAILKVD